MSSSSIARFTFVALISMSALQTSMALDSAGNSAQAVSQAGASVGNSVMSAGHAIAASGQATSAIASIPFSAAAAVGAVSGSAANASMQAATGQIGKPLPITDEVVTVVSPDEALKAKKATQTPN